MCHFLIPFYHHCLSVISLASFIYQPSSFLSLSSSAHFFQNQQLSSLSPSFFQHHCSLSLFSSHFLPPSVLAVASFTLGLYSEWLHGWLTHSWTPLCQWRILDTCLLASNAISSHMYTLPAWIKTQPVVLFNMQVNMNSQHVKMSWPGQKLYYSYTYSWQ